MFRYSWTQWQHSFGGCKICFSGRDNSIACPGIMALSSTKQHHMCCIHTAHYPTQASVQTLGLDTLVRPPVLFGIDPITYHRVSLFRTTSLPKQYASLGIAWKRTIFKGSTNLKHTIDNLSVICHMTDEWRILQVQLYCTFQLDVSLPSFLPSFQPSSCFHSRNTTPEVDLKVPAS